jgi:hypothetical protein
MTGKVVLVVEDPSDKAFWASVPHQAFPGRRGDVVGRVMHYRPKLIAAAWDWADRSRTSGRACTILLLDLDDDPCFSGLVGRFDPRVLEGVGGGDVAICIAAKCVETWLLADAASKIPRARKVAARYDPERAREHSPGFGRTWRIITERLA